MVETNEIYECDICGNVVSVVDGKGIPIECCGQEMTRLEEKTATLEGKEKHVPVIEKIENGVRVSVGSIHHPMEEDHYIEFIQILQNGKVIQERKLYPGDVPVAEFYGVEIDKITAREFCNKHGLWRN